MNLLKTPTSMPEHAQCPTVNNKDKNKHSPSINIHVLNFFNEKTI